MISSIAGDQRNQHQYRVQAEPLGIHERKIVISPVAMQATDPLDLAA